MSAETVRLITAIGAIATPVLLAVLSVIGWQVRRRVERRIELENQLRKDRVEIYRPLIADPKEVRKKRIRKKPISALLTNAAILKTVL